MQLLDNVDNNLSSGRSRVIQACRIGSQGIWYIITAYMGMATSEVKLRCRLPN
jgi:hypothetical protein